MFQEIVHIITSAIRALVRAATKWANTFYERADTAQILKG